MVIHTLGGDLAVNGTELLPILGQLTAEELNDIQKFAEFILSKRNTSPLPQVATDNSVKIDRIQQEDTPPQSPPCQQVGTDTPPQQKSRLRAPERSTDGNQKSNSKEVFLMMYPFLTLDDGTEITHSEMRPDGSVKVYVETPDEKDGFHDAICFLPEHRWTVVHGYSDKQMERFQEIIRNNAHLILEFSQKGGVLSAQIFRIGPYIVYFWSNENDPLEPVHVHIAEGRATANGTKVWITSRGKALLCNNNAKIPSPVLRNLLRVIEANSGDIVEKWLAHFGEISYFC